MKNENLAVKTQSPYFQKGFEAAIDNNGEQIENPYLESAGEYWENGFKDGVEFLKENQSK